MFVASLIEKAHVDSVPLLFAGLGLVTLVISLQPYTGGLGYRGIAFCCYGKRIWQFSNCLFGGLLIFVSLLLYLLFKTGGLSASNKVIIATIACLLCSFISDLVTLYLKRLRE
ncbi:hypothetical protein [Enterococcus sp. AZ007]|uniref:hypothetical protein n=1 Tax=Enterococcus sp. AZ007 TaxID=2774839 RepID=UPI003F250BE9